MATPVHVIKLHIGNAIKRRPRQKAPPPSPVIVLIRFIFKGTEWGFKRYVSTKSPRWCTRVYWHLKI